MNPWKPTAIALAGVVALLAGHEAAAARGSDAPPVPAPGYHRMEMALMHLREGRSLLETAEHDHGGWKERAIEHADRAIHETERAMEWAER